MSKITNYGLTRSGTGCFIDAPIWQQWASKVTTIHEKRETHEKVSEIRPYVERDRRC